MQSEGIAPEIRMSTNGDYTDEQLTAAILHVEDILSRCSIPFVVLGDAAFQMYNNMPLSGHRIVLGVMERHAMPECTSLIPTIEPNVEQQTDGWRIVFEQVPVYIKIITKDFNTLKEPDVIFSHYESWRIPNPFNEYWKGPHLDI